MQRHSERGAGKLSGLFWLLVFAAMIYAAWHVVPVYISNYSFADKMTQICRLPRGTNSDDVVLDQLMRAAQDNDLQGYLSRGACKVRTLDTSRTITCYYEREAQVLPGWRRVFRFDLRADQPLIF